MGEFVPFAGMIFSLLLALIIGGFVLLYPLTRRLGKLLELRLEERKSEPQAVAGSEEVERLRQLVEVLQLEVAALAERHEFTERLLERGRASGPVGVEGEGGDRREPSG